MKRIKLIKTVSLILGLFLMLTALTSCGKNMGKPLMTLGSEEITVNMYRLLLSRMKGNYGGGDDTVWDTEWEDGRTYNEIFTGFVKQNAMTYLCAMHEFGKLGLKLPDSTVKKIDSLMKSMTEDHGDGSKDKLNSILAQFGVNYDILREMYLTEEKLSMLEEHLYGENGTEAISETIRDEYYKNNYVRIKQIFFYTANKPVTNEDGSYVYDEEGHVTTRDYTEEELAEQKEKADRVMTSLTAGQDFELIMASQNEDSAASVYPSGYYLTKTSEYVKEVIDVAFELSENEFVRVESEYGIHIIKRFPLEEKGYASGTNSDFFTNFEKMLRTDLFTAYLSKYESEIKIDDELLSKYDVKSAATNTIY
ncbi:MAG: hypothetical protein E7671_04820 [Ruminococcaceae bacterium]|nr:hypothetical protein [Oscillospiraceae bacterium]